MSEMKQLNEKQLEKVSGGVKAYEDPRDVRYHWFIGDVVYSNELHSGNWKVLNNYVGFETHNGVQYYYAMLYVEKDGVYRDVYDEECVRNS